MLKKTILLTALVGALTAATGATAASFVTYYTVNEASWNGTWESYFPDKDWRTEDFNDLDLTEGLASIQSTGSGYIGSKPGRWWSDPNDQGQTGVQGTLVNSHEGEWRDVLTKNQNPNSTTTIKFSIDINSFGADFDFLPASLGTGVRMSFKNDGGEVFNTVFSHDMRDLFSKNDGQGFWGVFSENVFDEVVMTYGDWNGIKETYTMDDMRYGLHPDNSGRSSAIPGVPLPSALWMFVSALIGMTFVRRRPRAKCTHA